GSWESHLARLSVFATAPQIDPEDLCLSTVFVITAGTFCPIKAQSLPTWVSWMFEMDVGVDCLPSELLKAEM
ncbi:hypothetical protein AK812_SmicGene45437, partial [Symbiodinium microadriaticum]